MKKKDQRNIKNYFKNIIIWIHYSYLRLINLFKIYHKKLICKRIKFILIFLNLNKRFINEKLFKKVLSLLLILKIRLNWILNRFKL